MKLPSLIVSFKGNHKIFSVRQVDTLVDLLAQPLFGTERSELRAIKQTYLA